jgi:hypothetical protein
VSLKFIEARDDRVLIRQPGDRNFAHLTLAWINFTKKAPFCWLRQIARCPGFSHLDRPTIWVRFLPKASAGLDR